MVRLMGYAAIAWMVAHIAGLAAVAVGLWAPADGIAAWTSLWIAIAIGVIGWIMTGSDDEDEPATGGR